MTPTVRSGPKDKLDSTAFSQPAIYVASLAAVEKLRATEGEVSHQMHTTQSSTARISARRIVVTSSAALWSAQDVLQKADVAAGLSLGEYTALAFADAFRWVWNCQLNAEGSILQTESVRLQQRGELYGC